MVEQHEYKIVGSHAFVSDISQHTSAHTRERNYSPSVRESVGGKCLKQSLTKFVERW